MLLAPDIAITRGEYKKLFCHPRSVQLASEYALRDINDQTFCSGTCFADLAHAHPFLDGNGRAILTLHSEIMRRRGQHVTWELTDKQTFLKALTKDLENPGQGHFAAYLSPYIMDKPLTIQEIGARLKAFAA